MATTSSNIYFNSDLEAILEGISRLDTPALEVIAQKVNDLVAQRKEPRVSKRQDILIKKILGGGLPPTRQARFTELSRKLIDENISEDEHEELLTLITLNEAWAIERLQYLVELAHLRNTTIEKVMEQLGIVPPEVIVPSIYRD